MNSIKYTYSICFCMFALIFFITSPRVFAKEHTKEYSTIMTEHNFANINPLSFKRIYLAKLINKNKIKNIWKVDYFKSLNIHNIHQLSQEKPCEAIFKLSFFTISNINISDLNHITVENDKNLPFFDSENFNKADYNNIILLKKA
ncbi:hypothetical protein MTZ49_01150 [Entomomonas sp. E2T0]|uniref:hypothetical protein n=1 Tax=Entomomonas sp. E2T0 TaxID=2930213 RepID=UPI0022282AEB|nr:hypothetical protein [Entomomonas sp. E2T0]UYZ84216.1 hypothetical protein MTZ49_01150 [Entomomonas sp. E2T0]